MANFPYNPYQYNLPNYQMPLYTQPQQQSTTPAVRLVTSKEEVIGQQIPFDGSTSYFVDTSNGKIYAKAFDPNTGTAPIVTYVKEVETPVHYATIEDLNSLADLLRAELKPKRKVVVTDDE